MDFYPELYKVEIADLPAAPKAGACLIFRLKSKAGVSDRDR